MDIFVFNRDLELIGNIDTYEAFEFNRKLQEVGNFEFYINPNKDNKALFKKGNLIYKNDGYEEEAGIIEVIEREMDEEREVLRVAGDLTSILIGQRISLARILFNGKLEELIYKMVDENVINPSDAKRIIPNIKRATVKGFSETVDYEKSYGNILDEIIKLLEGTEIGFRTVFNPYEKCFVFELYKGIDRTITQKDRAPCIFSNEFENIYNEHYTLDTRDYKNTALVAGQEKDTERKKVIINDENKGYDRHEVFIDARDIQNKKFDESGLPTEETIPDSEYLKLLKERGRMKLSELTVLENFECDTNAHGNNEYRKDYNLGDKITVYSNNWGIQMDVLITEVSEIYENGNLEIRVGLGTPKLTISDEIKRIRKE